MNNHSVTNIIDLLDYLGEDKVLDILSDFSCPKNQEIENFLKRKAIEFAKQKMSITYLVFDEQRRLAGYFTLTHKSSLISIDMLSKTSQKKLTRYAKLDEATGCYNASAFLIAQFGKNYAIENGKTISGNQLMDYVFIILTQVQHLIGGGIVFLECEEKDKLLKFYRNDNNFFRIYGERISEKENKKYLQLLRFF